MSQQIVEELQPEFESLREQRLYGTMFGSIFGEGWPGLVAPRVVFYAYAVAHLILWVAISFAFAGLFSVLSDNSVSSLVLVASAIIHSVFIWSFLRVQRGEDAFKAWSVWVSMFVEFLFVWPLATVVFEIYHKWVSEDE